jgi:hypothetical protein
VQDRQLVFADYASGAGVVQAVFTPEKRNVGAMKSIVPENSRTLSLWQREIVKNLPSI